MPTQALLEWWIKTGLIYGLGFVFAAAILGIFSVFVAQISRAVIATIADARQKLPEIVDAHLDFIATTKANGEQLTRAVEAMGATHRQSNDNHARTHKALDSLVAAAQEAAIHVGSSKVQQLLGQAAKELERQ